MQNSFIQTDWQWPFLADVGVAGSDRTHHLARKLGTAITQRRMSFPAVIQIRREKAIQVVGKKVFEVAAVHRRGRYSRLQDARFEFSRRRRNRGDTAGLDSIPYRG